MIGDGGHIAASAAATTARRCVRCGEELGVEPWWVTTFPDGEHERCRDWSSRPFPFERHLSTLRRCLRHLAGDDRRAVIEHGRALAALRSRWPSEALTVLKEGRRYVAQARAHLEAVPAKVRSELG